MALDWDDVLAAALDQGWRKEETKKGYMLYPPDKAKSPVAVHRTPSDQRAIRNHISTMRQRGLQWPWLKKGGEVMAWDWSVLLQLTRAIEEPITDIEDKVFDLSSLLEEHAASCAFNDQSLDVRLTITSEKVTSAIEGAVDYLAKALEHTALGSMDDTWQLSHVEATEWSLFERLLEIPTYPELVGVSELAEMLGVSKQRASELARVARFPKPLQEFASGPVWVKPNIADFVSSWERRPGRPRKEAVAGLHERDASGHL